MEADVEGQSFCDMVFVCAGGVDEVPARRMQVAKRSPFFKNLLLKWVMPGGPSKRIPLPGIEGATMRICLEFFDTDTVQHSSWPDGSILLPLKVIAASQFFLVSELQDITISFLLCTTTWMRYQHSNEDDICARLAAAPGLLQEIVCAFNLGVQFNQISVCKKLQTILMRLGRVIDIGLLSYDRLEYHKYISQDAMVHLLESQTVLWGDASMWEYGWLQHIVHWCMYEDVVTNDHPVAEEAVIQDIVKRALPWQYKGSLDKIVHAESLFDRPLDPVTQRVIDALALSVQKWSGTLRVYLEDIPSAILSKFVEPLRLVPANTLACVRNLQAVDNWNDLRWDNFPENVGQRVGENEIEFSCNLDQFSGVSPCNLCSKFPGLTTLTWEIRLLKPCKVYRLGFALARPRRESFDGSNKWFWSLCSFGVLQYNGETRHCKEAYLKGNRVRVHIDLYHRVCSFLIDGRDIGACCDNLPLNGKVYPAIYMRKPGKVKITFLC